MLMYWIILAVLQMLPTEATGAYIGKNDFTPYALVAQI